MQPVFKAFLKVFLLVSLIWAGGFCYFLTLVPARVVDETTPVQAIVVLTGGRERLKTGFHLLCAGKGESLFISGVHREETLKSLFRLGEVSRVIGCADNQHIKAQTFLGYEAANTRENARETASWAGEHSVASLRLVTAAYHMPRSLLEVRKALPNVVIIPHPVFPKEQETQGFWKEGRVVRLTVLEYHKFLWACVRKCLLD